MRHDLIDVAAENEVGAAATTPPPHENRIAVVLFDRVQNSRSNIVANPDRPSYRDVSLLCNRHRFLERLAFVVHKFPSLIEWCLLRNSHDTDNVNFGVHIASDVDSAQHQRLRTLRIGNRDDKLRVAVGRRLFGGECRSLLFELFVLFLCRIAVVDDESESHPDRRHTEGDESLIAGPDADGLQPEFVDDERQQDE